MEHSKSPFPSLALLVKDVPETRSY